MAINTIPFLLFFLIVFFLYWGIKPLSEKIHSNWNAATSQNVILLIASYFFYGYTSLTMLPLFIGVTIVFYFLGLGIEKYEDTKKADWLMGGGVVLGVGLLLYFKYTNFFIGAFTDLLTACGLQCNPHTFNIIVPLGISYFVFRLLSYLIEIHRGMMSASKDFVAFATYVAFFPCMLSGPIDRPDKFLPQITKNREFTRPLAVDGLRQILWGMFKKVAVADTIAIFVDAQLAPSQITHVSGSTMIFVILAYTFQIYADFSGYSDMAIGVSKLLGLQVARNFRYPFFALNIADFWHRWHMSLTSWMTDYVYMPLNYAFRKQKKIGVISAVIINFIVVGIWHGANWNYLIYGFYHGLLFVPLIFLGTMNASMTIQTNQLGLPIIKDFGRMVLTFILIALGMIIFRSTDIITFTNVMTSFGRDFWSIPEFGTKLAWFFIIIMMAIEWIQRNHEYGLDITTIRYRTIRWSIYLFLIFCVFARGGGEQHFIYQVF